MHSNCPLCESQNFKSYFYQEKFNRELYKCGECDLVFVNRRELLSEDIEKSRYDGHENNKLTVGYEKFLTRLIDPLVKNLKLGSTGLDYGCGPYPMLIELLQRQGIDSVVGYDPFYNNQLELFENKYDFITCCEVIEHISDIKFNLNRIYNSLLPGSFFIISTGIRVEDSKFKDWYYIRDDTHINFFSLKTLDWIAKQFEFEILEIKKDLIIYLKK